MDRGGDRIEETGIGIGREIDRDMGLRRDCTDDLDIEHHLPVGSVRIAGWMILAVVHRDRGDFWTRADAERREIRVQIRVSLTAAEFDNPDALPRPRSGGEVIERRDLERREGGGAAAIGVPLHIPGRRPRTTEMRLCDRPIVEAEHGFDAVVQFVRQMDASDPPAI